MLVGMIADTKTNQTRRNGANGDNQFRSGNANQAVILEVSTRRYLAAGGGWTSDLNAAAAFRSVAAATEHLRRMKLVMVQLVSTGNFNICEVASPAQIGVNGWSSWLTPGR
jgi:hypothetical protein